MRIRHAIMLVALTLASSNARAGGGEVMKLVPADNMAGDRFGYAIAVDGTTLIATAWYDDDPAYQSGSAYAFDLVTGQ